jgi:UDP:flavonoid glycosyltransferase YjiC (YdhE family)
VSRFLIVTLPLTGHVNPALGVSQALQRRGHQVAWAGPRTVLRPAAGAAATIYPTGLRLYRSQGDHGLTSVKTLWDGYLLPLARFTLGAVDAAVRDYRPDVVVADQHAFAGALAAQRQQARWATLAPSAMELTRPYRALPGVERWVAGRLAALREWALRDRPPEDRAAAGLAGALPVVGGPVVDGPAAKGPAAGASGLLASPSLLLACTTTALTGAAPLPAQAQLIGPVLGGRPAGPAFEWGWLDPGRRHVLVTVGTLAADIAAGFCERAVAALAPLAGEVQAIVVAPAGALPDPPANVLVAPQVPLLELMPRLDAVVCHGGMNTVREALAHAVPLVIAPIRHDQPVAAAQVAAAGAGLRVPFTRVRPGELRTAVQRLLHDPGYRGAANEIRESFRAAGGEDAAAEHLTRLASRSGNIHK